MDYVILNNGVKMPQIGYGLYLVSPEEAERCTVDALKAGYRLIDTAQKYGNESGTGIGMKKSGISREDIFLVSKMWPSDYSYKKAKKSIDSSLSLLQTDYLDLLLLHQPFGDIYDAYQALEDAYREGKVRAIGVSNFYADRFLDIASNVEIKPAVNQVEMHIFNQEAEIRKVAEEFDTKIMAWGPLVQGKFDIFKNPVLKAIGEKHHKVISQISLRYLLQTGVIAIPKSTHIERMKENIDIFDFELSPKEMEQIRNLDQNKRLLDHRSLDLVRWFMSTMKR